MADRPLHQLLPALAQRVPHRALATLPTPLEERSGPAGACLCKLDGQTDTRYGGNKLRKLEYLLAQALAHGATRVATFGAAGSNHATATAVHAQALGLGCVTFLSRQRHTPWIAPNLRRQVAAGSDIVYVDGPRAQREAQARDYLRRLPGKSWSIPMGGSSLAGTLGYVNAGLELAEQLADGAPPDRLYVPLGTMGTAVGLALGLAMAGCTVPVHAVRVVHETVGSAARARRRWVQMTRLLRTLAPGCNPPALDPQRFIVRDEFFGVGYAHATPAASDAVTYAREHLALELETTYSGKTLAALLHDARSRAQRVARPLFVCTYQSDAPPPPAIDVATLPPELQPYFDEPRSVNPDVDVGRN